MESFWSTNDDSRRSRAPAAAAATPSPPVQAQITPSSSPSSSAARPDAAAFSPAQRAEIAAIVVEAMQRSAPPSPSLAADAAPTDAADDEDADEQEDHETSSAPEVVLPANTIAFPFPRRVAGAEPTPDDPHDRHKVGLEEDEANAKAVITACTKIGLQLDLFPPFNRISEPRAKTTAGQGLRGSSKMVTSWVAESDKSLVLDTLAPLHRLLVFSTKITEILASVRFESSHDKLLVQNLLVQLQIRALVVVDVEFFSRASQHLADKGVLAADLRPEHATLVSAGQHDLFFERAGRLSAAATERSVAQHLLREARPSSSIVAAAGRNNSNNSNNSNTTATTATTATTPPPTPSTLAPATAAVATTTTMRERIELSRSTCRPYGGATAAPQCRPSAASFASTA